MCIDDVNVYDFFFCEFQQASGLTIENKRPLRTADFDADVSGSREGSVSPSTRKRKKVNQRRKSLAESNSLLGES